ncbi:hypothetical protein [Micromonospora sp. NPDC126480]|uniref:hypothetical protein n=1 Tax=Micromonospora sp. NPDC126480 TaxID=3155312 RepID=UPI00331B8386
MANKMLGKVVAGAALGGASLLVFTPGIAFADGHHENGGKVFAKPHVVKAGHEVKLLQICEEPQEHAYVWSKVTGKVKLKPVKDSRGDWREDDKHGKDKKRDHKDDWKDDKHGKDKGRDHKDDWKDDKGHGKDDPKPPRPEPTETVTTQPAPPANGERSYGQGGGAADAADEKDRKDWKGYEHGQDAEGGRDSKDHEEYDSEGDWKGHEDEKSKGRDGHDSEEGDWSDEESGDHGKDRWEHKREFVYYGEAKVDWDAKPGKYELKGSCGEGKLVVLPRGGVDGGDGGMSTGADRGLAAGGASLLGAAALGGLVLLRRRTDGSLV